MRKSEPQPRSRKTPTGGKRMAKLLEQGQKWVWNRGRDSNVQNLAKGIVSTMCTRKDGNGRHTLQMSDPVKAMVVSG